MPLEIACFTPSSALTAARSGADRIELCASYALGGVTPDISSLVAIRREIPPCIPIHIMIRPRAGNFHYSTAEFEVMRSQVALFAPLASGFVFGILDAGGRVDVARNSELVDIAAPLACTFHRAVDEAGDLEGAVETVAACGFRSVLTSGGSKSAVQGVGRLKKLVDRYGANISVVVGGGVRRGNVKEIKTATGAEWVHSAAITGEGEEVDSDEVRGIKEALGEGGDDEKMGGG
ncbi:hypothetical protein ACEQ8H_007721 [Pleosporales sp. CAS-2024a]